VKGKKLNRKVRMEEMRGKAKKKRKKPRRKK